MPKPKYDLTKWTMETRWLGSWMDLDGIAIDEVIAMFIEISLGLTDAHLEIERDYGRDFCVIDFIVVGWRLLTEEEIIQRENEAKNLAMAKTKQAMQTELDEIRMLKKLAKKYPTVIK